MAGVPRHMPKDAQVILAIMKDMGIQDYDQRVLTQLLEFTYRYVTTVLEDARVLANHAKKKAIDLDDLKLAVQMTTDRIFTNPPPREILLDVARTKNSTPLPLVKPHCGLRLPPDRYCLSSCNYRLKSMKKPQPKQQIVHHMSGNTGTYMTGSITSLSNSGNVKLSGSKQQQQHLQQHLQQQQQHQQQQQQQQQAQGQQSMSIVKRQGPLTTVSRTQTITIPKPVIKLSAGPSIQKPVTKPKVQITSGTGTLKIDDSDPSGGSLKRKREDESEDYDTLE